MRQKLYYSQGSTKTHLNALNELEFIERQINEYYV